MAAIACALDQASKLYLLFVIRPRRQRPIRLGPFFDFVLTRNTGISYGLFQTKARSANGCCSASRRWPSWSLWVWLARAKDRLIALSLGLIIGGAVGNAIDRLAYGWVVDFVFFHVSDGELAVQLVRF